MCGSLRHEKIDKKIGCLVPFHTADGQVVEAKWLGFSRVESPLPDGDLGVIPATEYTEKGITFQVEKGYGLLASLIKKETLPGGEGLFIHTRPATEDELKKCSHNRHPVQVGLYATTQENSQPCKEENKALSASDADGCSNCQRLTGIVFWR